MSRSVKRLDKHLLDLGLVESRAKAQALILKGCVFVNSKKVDKCGFPVTSDVRVEIHKPNREWVSRGAFKLLKALDSFSINPTGLLCLDVGASTGGFTEVLLDRGASRVYAVDVGYGQFAWKLRMDPRVVLMERTNARSLSLGQFPSPFDLIVVDVSFISLRLILPVVINLLGENGQIITLVKPQFEAGREFVKKGGVIKDPGLHKKVLVDLASFIETETPLDLIGADFSPLKGPKGNIEFLFHIIRPTRDQNETNEKPLFNFALLDEVVERAHEQMDTLT